MTAAYSNALHAKLHNQSIKVKQLEAELAQVRLEAQEAIILAQSEVETIQKSLRKEQRKSQFYKGKFLLLKREIERPY